MLHSFALVASLLGVGLAAYLWQVEGSGISGTLGALLAVIGAAAVFVAGLFAAMLRSWRRPRGWITGLASLAAALTAVAAWFLMQNVLAILMAVAGAALVLDMVLTPARRVAV